ncbi:MAG: DUF3040 domain-containing protein [Acidimicrobiales bacterium]
MPLSEEEQRILSEIEQQFYATDPAFAREVGKTSLYTRASKARKLSAAGFVISFGLLLAFFRDSLVIAFLAFAAMFGCAYVMVASARRVGPGPRRPPATAATDRVRSTLADTSQRLRRKFQRDK